MCKSLHQEMVASENVSGAARLLPAASYCNLTCFEITDSFFFGDDLHFESFYNKQAQCYHVYR